MFSFKYLATAAIAAEGISAVTIEAEDKSYSSIANVYEIDSYLEMDYSEPSSYSYSPSYSYGRKRRSYKPSLDDRDLTAKENIQQIQDLSDQILGLMNSSLDKAQSSRDKGIAQAALTLYGAFEEKFAEANQKIADVIDLLGEAKLTTAATIGQLKLDNIIRPLVEERVNIGLELEKNFWDYPSYGWDWEKDNGAGSNRTYYQNQKIKDAKWSFDESVNEGEALWKEIRALTREAFAAVPEAAREEIDQTINWLIENLKALADEQVRPAVQAIFDLVNNSYAEAIKDAQARFDELARARTDAWATAYQAKLKEIQLEYGYDYHSRYHKLADLEQMNEEYLERGNAILKAFNMAISELVNQNSEDDQASILEIDQLIEQWKAKIDPPAELMRQEGWDAVDLWVRKFNDFIKECDGQFDEQRDKLDNEIKKLWRKQTGWKQKEDDKGKSSYGGGYDLSYYGIDFNFLNDIDNYYGLNSDYMGEDWFNGLSYYSLPYDHSDYGYQDYGYGIPSLEDYAHDFALYDNKHISHDYSIAAKDDQSASKLPDLLENWDTYYGDLN